MVVVSTVYHFDYTRRPLLVCRTVSDSKKQRCLNVGLRRSPVVSEVNLSALCYAHCAPLFMKHCALRS